MGIKTTDRDFPFYTTFSVCGIVSFCKSISYLKSLIKEVIDNLGIVSENLEFVSISTVYEENNGAIVVATSIKITPT